MRTVTVHAGTGPTALLLAQFATPGVSPIRRGLRQEYLVDRNLQGGDEAVVSPAAPTIATSSMNSASLTRLRHNA